MEQKINVKNTYVATVKNDVVDRALSFYVKPKEDFFVESSIFPSVDNSDKVVDNNQNNVVVEVPKELNLDDTITIPVVENTTVQEPAVSESVATDTVVETPQSMATEPVVEPVASEPLAGIPNLSVLEPIPNVPPVAPVPEPIPNPIDTPVNPIPVNDNISNVGVNDGPVVDSQPVRFDASHETNLLGSLGTTDDASKIGNINVTPENLNAVRDFGVDQPATNALPANNPSGGFVNNKIVLVIVILLFLASCVFLGYEIYNYFILSK